MANPNYDELLTTTLANHRESFTDNVFARRPLANFLKTNGRVKMKTGGHKLVLPVHLEKAPGASSYGRGDGLVYTQFQLGTAAEYAWKRVQAPVAIDRLDEAVNRGEEELIDILDERVMLAEESLTEMLNTMWYGDGTGNSNKDWNGLKLLIGDELDAITTVGGIDCAAVGNEKWRSHVVRAAGSFSTATRGGKACNGIDRLRTALNTTTYGSDRVDLIMTTQAIYEAFDAEQDSKVQLVNAKMIDAGFENFKYKGVTVAFDEQIPAPTGVPTGHLAFGVNSKRIGLYGLSGTWFTSDPFEKIQGTDIRGTHIRAYGQMATDSRRSHFRIEFAGV